jgi:hypothetical protein
MPRLNIIAEGQTEEAFVHAVLLEPLAERQVYVAVRCVETSRDKRRGKIHRGGLLNYQKARGDLHRWMKEDQNPDAHFTTMFDLYALPPDFPDFDEAGHCPDPYQRVAALEVGFGQDIDHPRFIPYIQLHEFEALLLSDPAKFDWEFIEHQAAIDRLVTMCGAFASPELIDDGAETAPSKRIIKEIPEYEGRKASAGPLTAAKIGLATLRAKCRHFNDWLGRLEALGA